MAVKLPIYLDNHATTPADPRVVEAMIPYLTEVYGNAASRNHAFGWAAKEAVEVAREQVAALIGASAKEIVFTSGATESDNLAITGVAKFHEAKGKHIVTNKIEHKAIARHLRSGGGRSPPRRRQGGLVDPAWSRAAAPPCSCR
jgi:cysteine desulfurase